MTTEGAISVHLDVARGRVDDVVVTSTRPLRAARVVTGRAPADVQRLVALLFPVCGRAQGIACARALDAALGIASEPERERARDVVALAEAIASHIWQMAIGWREAARVPSRPELVRAARRAADRLAEALLGTTPNDPPFAWGDAREISTELRALLEETLASEPPLFAAIRNAGREEFGSASRVEGTASLDPIAIGASLATDERFADAPTLHGKPLDVSASAHGGAPVAPGRGLLARFTHRRDVARADGERLEALVSGGAVTNRPTCAAVEGGGVGLALTARGPLLHWARANREVVTDFRVLAPTDWTFHPSGVLREALLGVEAGPELWRDAGWLVLALDPCVPWSIHVGGKQVKDA